MDFGAPVNAERAVPAADVSGVPEIPFHTCREIYGGAAPSVLLYCCTVLLHLRLVNTRDWAIIHSVLTENMIFLQFPFVCSPV